MDAVVKLVIQLIVCLALFCNPALAAFRSVGTVGQGTTASITPGTPAGAAADDILILVASYDATGRTFTWPSGFTQLYLSTLTLDGQVIGVAWKLAVGSDSLATTVSGATGSPWVVRCFAWSGRDTGNPPVGSTAATSSAANASPTTVTANGVTAAANDDLFWIAGLDTSVASSGTALTQPAGYTSQGVFNATDNFSSVGAATKDAVSSGATGSVAGSLTHSGNAGWAAFLIRIPAAGGAAVAGFNKRLKLEKIGY